MSLAVGDVVKVKKTRISSFTFLFFPEQVIKNYSQGWCYGENVSDHRKGLFPSSYVEHVSNTPVAASVSTTNLTTSAPASSASSNIQPSKQQWALALKDYSNRDPSHLAFKKGDPIVLLEVLPTGWLKGQNGGKYF